MYLVIVIVLVTGGYAVAQQDVTEVYFTLVVKTNAVEVEGCIIVVVCVAVM